MNWLYLIPVVAAILLIFQDPVGIIVAIVIVVGGGLAALWLHDKMRGK